MRVKQLLKAVTSGRDRAEDAAPETSRLRRDLRRAAFTLVAFLVIAVPSSAVIDSMSASSVGDAAAVGLSPWDDESLLGDDEVLFDEEGGDLFDPDGGELDFVDWEIDEPFPDEVEDNGFAPEETFFYEDEISENLTADGIPFVAVQAYQMAEATSAVADPGCGVPWYLLAAIGRVESNHGRFGGSRLLTNGDGTKPIRGLPLNGAPGLALIRDTDGGALDGDTTYDRAVGPMQFIPSTWRGVQVDGNRDRRRDPNNMFDATLGAAGYLCSGPGNLRDPAQQRDAVRRYNHTEAYVRVVMSVAAEYADQSAGQPRVPLPMPVPRPAPDTRPPARPAPPTTTAPRPAPPAPSPPTTQATAPTPPTTQPPTTQPPAPTPPTTAPPTPTPEDPDGPDTPDAPDTPDVPTDPEAPEVPMDPSEGVPTDPSHDDDPADPTLPPAAVGWSGTMLDFVTETLAERPECAAGPDADIAVAAPGSAPEACPPAEAAPESDEGAAAPAGGGPVPVPASATATTVAARTGATRSAGMHPPGVALTV